MLHAAGDVFQFSIWALKEGKGIDDYLALKAGTDPAEQRKELASAALIARSRSLRTLTSTTSPR